jgi:hypothetical protein
VIAARGKGTKRNTKDESGNQWGHPLVRSRLSSDQGGELAS